MNPEFAPESPADVLRRWEATHNVWRPEDGDPRLPTIDLTDNAVVASQLGLLSA